MGGRSQALRRGDHVARGIVGWLARVRADVALLGRSAAHRRATAAEERQRRQRARLERRVAQLDAARTTDARRIAGLERIVGQLHEEKIALHRVTAVLSAEDAQAADARALVARLRRRFPSDRIEVRRRGLTVVDVVHRIRSGSQTLATVLYVVREDAAWRPAFVRAAKRSAARDRADVAIVVSRSLPPPSLHMTVVNGVTVVRPSLAEHLAITTRDTTLQTARALATARRSRDRMRRRAALVRRLALVRAALARAVAVASVETARIARAFGIAIRSAIARASRAAGSLRPRRAPPAAQSVTSVLPRVASAEPLTAAPAVLTCPEPDEPPLPSEPVARALCLELRAQYRIARGEARSPTVLEAAHAFLERGWRDAALDLLLERLSAGDRDRNTQLLLLDIACAGGHENIAREKAKLLASLLRMDGDEAGAARLEAAAARVAPPTPPSAEVDPRLALLADLSPQLVGTPARA